MGLYLQSISRNSNGFSISLKEQITPKCTECVQHVTRSGSKYYAHFLSNGTVKCGMYDAKGTWHRVAPSVLNDFLQLDDTLILHDQYVCVNHDTYGITEEAFKGIMTEYSIENIQSQMIKEHLSEYRLDATEISA